MVAATKGKAKAKSNDKTRNSKDWKPARGRSRTFSNNAPSNNPSQAAMRSPKQGLLDDGIAVPVTKLCAWFDVPRRTVCYKPIKADPKRDDRFVAPIKTLIVGEPSLGYRTVAWLLGFHTKLVRSYGLKQEFITPRCPQQNGMMERLIRSLKEQCVHRHRFENLAHASRAIGDWIQFYNHKFPHQTLAMRSPNEAFKLAA